MSKGKPSIKDCKDDWTRITWSPDLAKFGMETLDDDMVDLFVRRAYDMAGCTHHTVKVYLNNKRISTSSFGSYVDLFLGPKMGPDSTPRCTEKASQRARRARRHAPRRADRRPRANNLCFQGLAPQRAPNGLF